MGLATLRQDGFAGMRGSGSLVTDALPCTGGALLLTVDVLRAGGSVSVNGSEPLTANGTAVVVAGLDLSAHVGGDVVLRLNLRDAIVYTVGFAAR